MMKEFTSSKSAERHSQFAECTEKQIAALASHPGQVLLTWRLIFRQIHNEKAEKDRKDRGAPMCVFEDVESGVCAVGRPCDGSYI